MNDFLRGMGRVLGLPPKPSPRPTPEQVVERALQRAYARLADAVEQERANHEEKEKP